MRVRTTLTSLVCAAALSLPAVNAYALVRSARQAASAKGTVVVDASVEGTIVKCNVHNGRWGWMQVKLDIQQTESVVNGVKKVVSVKITGVSWPLYPDHTPRSAYINHQALPLLQQEVLSLQMSAGTQLQNISGASNTTVSFTRSLQAALLLAEQPQ